MSDVKLPILGSQTEQMQEGVPSATFLNPELERFVLPHVRKPGRYWYDHIIGHRGKQHSKTTPSPEGATVLLIPRSYERGYHHGPSHSLLAIADRAGLTLDRCYLYEADALLLLKQTGKQPITISTHRPLRDADIIVLLMDEPAELLAAGVMLTAAGIPIVRSSRTVHDPLILVAGQLARTPKLPLVWADAVFITNDDQSIGDSLVRLQRAGRTAHRNELLSSIPHLITSSKLVTGADQTTPWYSPSVEAHQSATMSSTQQTTIVPLIDTVRDSYPGELWRSSGDRLFPIAPVSSSGGAVSPTAISQLLDKFRSSGMSTLELSPALEAEPSQWVAAVRSVARQMDGSGCSLHLPLMRPESCTPELLEIIARLKKTPLQLLAVTGSTRLRAMFALGDSVLVHRAVQTAFDKGWRQLSIQFWVGLPTETEDDQQSTVEMIHQLAALVGGPGQRHLVIELRPFVPIPHTPYQWDPIATLEQLREFQARLGRKGLSGVQVRLDDRADPMLTTGLRRMNPSDASNLLNKLVTRYFLELESPVFNRPEQLGIPVELLLTDDERTLLASYCGPISFSTDLPWSCLRMEASALELQTSRTSGSVSLSTRATESEKQSTSVASTSSSGFGRDKKRLPSRTLSAPTRNRIRIQLERGEEVRFLSHLDFLRMIERAVRRAQLPVAHSGEEQRLMKLSFGPPLPVGATSACEYFDITLESVVSPALMEKFAQGLPNGVRICQAKSVFGREESLAAAINRVDYEILLGEWSDIQALTTSINALLSRSTIEIDRESKQTIKRIDIRPALRHLDVRGEKLCMTLCLEEGSYARPTEVLTQLADGLRYPVAAVPLHRLRLYRETADGAITEGMQL